MDLINVNSVLYDKNTGSMNVALPVNSSSDLSQSPSPPAHIDNEKVLQDLKLLTRVHPTTSITSVIGNYSKPETPRATIYKLTRMDMVGSKFPLSKQNNAHKLTDFIYIFFIL